MPRELALQKQVDDSDYPLASGARGAKKGMQRERFRVQDGTAGYLLASVPGATATGYGPRWCW